MSDDNQEEAFARLGGVSRIAKLEERLGQLEQWAVTQEGTETERDVEVGSMLTPGAPGTWYDASGVFSLPTSQCCIVGIGYDWIVVRDTDNGRLYFSAQHRSNIRRRLSSFVV